MTSYIILAQGKGERLKAVLGESPKQGLPLTRSRTILQRTLWMIERRHRRRAGDDSPAPVPIVVAPYSLEYQLIGMRAALHVLDEPGLCVLDGLAQTRPFWADKGRTVILLGDVIWASQDFEFAAAGVGPVQFAQTAELTRSTGEIFSVMWSSDVNALIERCLEEVPCRHGRHRQDYAGVAQPGHLRNLKWALDRYLGRYSRHFVTSGYTRDIDTPEDLQDLPQLSRLAQLDDDSYERATEDAARAARP